MSDESQSRAKRWQILTTVSFVLVVGALEIYRALHPDPYNQQAVTDVTYHPLAYAIGSITPLIIAAPIAYWMFGRVFRRIEAKRAN